MATSGLPPRENFPHNHKFLFVCVQLSLPASGQREKFLAKGRGWSARVPGSQRGAAGCRQGDTGAADTALRGETLPRTVCLFCLEEKGQNLQEIGFPEAVL